VKQAKKMGEDAKVAVRNHRREANETLKKMEKEKQISEDDSKRGQDEIQKKTDTVIAEVEKVLEGKEKEIMTV